MPWRLVFFIIILGFVVIFAGFNITNASDISFGFYTAIDVPIFISLFFAFAVGVVVMMPFAVGKIRQKRKSTPVPEPLPGQMEPMPEIPPDLPDPRIHE